jgi:transposase, IS5 family
MRGQPGFFDIDDRLRRLSDLGDQLEAFPSAVDFELFRPELNAALSYTDRTEGGRPPPTRCRSSKRPVGDGLA